MAGRMVETEVFLEPGRVTSDGNPLRYVELRHRFVRTNRRLPKPTDR